MEGIATSFYIKKIPKHILAWLMCVGVWTAANATHIVGGEMGYECLGEGDYRITMKMYRNCNSLAQGGFPSPAAISIYEVDDAGNYIYLNLPHGDAVFLQNNNVTDIPIPDLPCLIPPDDVCVEEGTYTFETNLPLSSRSYFVIFQRCCRNETITNILTPGDIGTTVFIEITPEAQANCNSSPVFDGFPPIVVCANEPLAVNHAATDADGDQLVYEFCSPLEGGGLAGTNGVPGSPVGCQGFMPTPACPPPFNEVNFVVPSYNATQPMGGAPVVSINPITGEITGVPNTLGQFVVGVCVKEYRNGTLLSTTRRDFQFNVEQCDPLIEPLVVADEVLDDRTFVIHSCGDSLINITNQSTLPVNVDEYFWEFMVQDSVRTYTQWSPAVALPDTGQYEGFLYLNPDSECGDTGRVLLNYYPAAAADFLASYDTCEVGDVSFLDASQQGTIAIDSWLWDLGNGTISTEANPVVLYENIGTYEVSLAVVDENGCEDATQQTVDWFPAPELIVIDPSAFLGCPPADIFFNNLTQPIDDTYAVLWSFDDGTTSDEVSPRHVFDTTGNYTISVEITSPFGCKTERTFPDLIEITPTPIADFAYTPLALDNFNSTVVFIDSSLYNDSWYWQFDDESDAYIQAPTYTFRDTGVQAITLLVTHPNGCADTITRFLDVVPKTTYFLPNAFTPNGDGINDVFVGKGYLEGISDFSFEIWNRWGEKIFETDDPTEGWNGTKNNTGQPAPAGIYQCFVQYIGPRGAAKEFQGTVTVIR